MDFKISLEGFKNTAILMHSNRLANPFDPQTEQLSQLTSARGKTRQDREEIARMEWTIGMHYHPSIGPFIPSEMLHASLVGGAKKTRHGQKIKSGLIIDDAMIPLQYNGPRTLDELWGEGLEGSPYIDLRMAKVQTNLTPRCRPKFENWSITTTGWIDDTQLSLNELQNIATTAGRIIGMGDYRPKFGRYTATITEA